jgi:hypothetical protein
LGDEQRGQEDCAGRVLAQQQTRRPDYDQPDRDRDGDQHVADGEGKNVWRLFAGTAPAGTRSIVNTQSPEDRDPTSSGSMVEQQLEIGSASGSAIARPRVVVQKSEESPA